MGFSETINQIVAWMPAKSGWGLLLMFMALSMALVPGAWGREGMEAPVGTAVAVAQNAVVEAVPTEDEEERSFVNDEPREMPGIMVGAIVVNLTIVSVCFFLLWREWRKHKTKRPGEAGKQGGS